MWKSARKGQCLLLTSEYVIEKARRNLYHADQRERFEISLSDVQVVLEADERIRCPIDLHENDRAVLMAAISSTADYLITGDREHYGKYIGQTIMGVKICMARDYFLETQQTR